MNSNVGLLHEALVSKCASAVVTSKSKSAASAVRLSKRFFAQGRPLNAELKLHLSLSKPAGLTELAASKLVEAAKLQAVATAQPAREDVQKCASVLARALRGCELTISDAAHKRHATVANLIESWRCGAAPSRVAALESSVVKMMTAAVPSQSDVAMSALPAPAHVVKRMMTVRLAEAYGDKLTGAHREIVVAAVSGDAASLRERAARGAIKMRAAASVSGLEKSAAQSLTELAEKLDAAASPESDIISDVAVAQLLACVDVEREIDSRS